MVWQHNDGFLSYSMLAIENEIARDNFSAYQILLILEIVK